MLTASTHPAVSGQARLSPPLSGKFVLVPILVCLWDEIISPLLLYAQTGPRAGVGGMWSAAQQEILFAPRIEHKIFWPPLAAISVILAIRHWSRLTLPPHITYLFWYLAFAGASVLWAFKPEFSSVRVFQQAMIVISIVLPALLAARTVDMMRGLFLCFALALIVNLFFVLDQAPMLLENGRRGYPGYFTFKGVLGECAAFALLLSLHELVYSGWRRMLGVIVIGIAIYLVILSDSNGSLSLALVAPVLAGITLLVGKKTRASVAVVLLPIPLLYAGLDSVVGNLVNRISWYLYGNFTLTGRTIIWDFVSSAIALNPLVGWGYRSFWLVGSDGPSLGAPGWVRAMPSSHNGFMEAKLDLGYVGLTLLVVFIFATLHAIGRVAVRDTPRAWLLLTLALYIILTNFLETGWMHGDDMLWLMFLFVAAEAGRYWQPSFRGAPEPIRRSPRIAARRPSLARAQVSGKLGRF